LAGTLRAKEDSGTGRPGFFPFFCLGPADFRPFFSAKCNGIMGRSLLRQSDGVSLAYQQ
jgi:hypothetical protein